MKIPILLVIISAITLQICYAPPVSQNKKENEVDEDESEMNRLEDYMEYHRYLKEVVSALESDPDFRTKLEKADESEIKSGKIAEELEFVSHHVRTKLDEIKRVELKRLKELTEKKRKLENLNSIDEDPTHHHLDHSNPHTFEIEDLKKLIAKTTQDLAEADKKRQEQFKQYEMEKEYKKQEKLNHTNGTDREKLQKQYEEMEEKHKKHKKLHEPGHKAQLEEVWEEQDQMQQDFNPKTFFMLHDIDGNGLWDQDEVKSLFLKELDKMYQQGAPEDDMRERAEEMERMRESVFKEMDRNQDGFIDFNEFWQQTLSNDFKQDHGWQGIDERRPYTDEELAEYIRQHEANQLAQGYVAPGGQVPLGAYHQAPSGGYQQVHPGGYQQVQSGYQNVPPGGYQQVPPGGYQQGPPGGYQQGPPGGYQQGPAGGYQQGPPGGYQQIPPGGYQHIPSGAYNPNVAPQEQGHPGQVHQSPQQPLRGNDLNNEIYQQGYQQHQQQQRQYQQQQQQPQPPGQMQQQQQQQPQPPSQMQYPSQPSNYQAPHINQNQNTQQQHDQNNQQPPVQLQNDLKQQVVQQQLYDPQSQVKQQNQQQINHPNIQQ